MELREQLAVVLGALAQRDAVIGQLRGELAAAAAEIAELRRQLGQNSRNSSKPPSSDGLAKPAPRSLRRRGARKPGGQDGHPGSTLAPVATPDEVVAHEPGCCRGCGDDLAEAPEVGRDHRQVFDLPPITPRVIEHQLIKRRCGCGTTTSAAAPAGVTAPVQYGPRITAIIVYLYVGRFLSRKRTATALAELFGTPVSAGTVAAMTTRAAGSLDGTVALTDDVLGQAGLMRRRSAPASRSSFAGFRFPPEVIMLAVRWYLRYGLSYRDVEELLAERGVEVDHVSVYRWVQRFTPLLIDAASPRRHAPGDRWFVDETYVKVAGRWTYLYRAIDQYGQVIDVLVSEKRDLTATRLFFSHALERGPHSTEVNTDRAPAYPRAAAHRLPHRRAVRR